MTELQLSNYGLDRPESGDDVVVPFALETLDARGRVVRRYVGGGIGRCGVQM